MVGSRHGKLEAVEVATVVVVAFGAWQSPDLRPWVIRTVIATGVALLIWATIRIRRVTRRRKARRTLSGLRALDPADFEHHVASLLRRRGWRAEVSGGAGDLGVDVYGLTPDGRTFVCQAKRYADGRKVTGPQMQTFIGMGRLQHDADVLVYATTGDLTAQAAQLAADHDVLVIRGARLAHR